MGLTKLGQDKLLKPTNVAKQHPVLQKPNTIRKIVLDLLLRKPYTGSFTNLRDKKLTQLRKCDQNKHAGKPIIY